MSDNKIGRRKFVQAVSLTSIAILPGVDILAGLTGRNDPLQYNFIKKAFRMIDHRNLLTLEFYFINVSEKDGFLKKEGGGFLESYMIVRLPQQHIAEDYIDSSRLASDKSFFAVSYIAGYSYLVFRIFFDKLGTTGMQVSKESFLDWNKDHFRLVVRQNLKDSIFDLVKQTDTPEAGSTTAGERLNRPEQENHYPLGYRKENGRLTFDKHNFPKVHSKEHNGQLIDPSPVTAIELPYRLILSPQLPDQDNYRFRWIFPKEPVFASSCSFNELWMVTLKAQRLPLKRKIIEGPAKIKTDQSSADLPEEIANSGDNFLKLLMIGSPDSKTKKGAARDCERKQDLLPNAADRADLVELYIKYKLAARAPKLSFTPLGACTDIEFKNTQYAQTLKIENSLYEWKQSISFGRDQKAEVSRVVLENCFGLKMLHIRKTKRETYKGGSILVYREFLMPLELEKDFTLFDNESASGDYANANWKCNSPFKKVEFAETGAKQIMTLESMIKGSKEDKSIDSLISFTGTDVAACQENVFAFWPLTRDGHFIEWPFKVTDWHDNVHVCKKKIHIYTSNLAFNNQDGIFNFPDNLASDIEQRVFRKVKDTDEFISIKQHVSDELIKQIDAQKWVGILDKAEHFTLKKIDYYTDYLENVFTATENKLRAAAKNIEDQVIEEWCIFKRKILEKEEKLLGVLDKFSLYIEDKVFEANSRMDSIKKEILKIRRDILSKIDIGVATAETLQPELTRLKAQIQDAITAVINNKTKEANDFFIKLTDNIGTLQLNFLTGFEQEYMEFLAKIPARLRGQVKSIIGKDVENIRACVNEIRGIEGSVKSRIDFYKSKIGYAVYKVEDELDKVKERIKQRVKEVVGDKWEEEWEKEYEKVREIYQKEVNAKLSELETDFIILKGNVKNTLKNKAHEAKEKIFDFFDDYACFPQLHSASVYIKQVNDLVNKEIPCKIRYAEDYVKNQVNNVILDTKNNVSRVFLEVKADSREYVKSAVREIKEELGGIINPDLAAEYLSYLKDTRTQVERATAQVLDTVKDAEAQIKNTIDSIKGKGEEMAREALDRIKQETSYYKAIEDDMKAAISGARNSMHLIGSEAKKHFEEYRDWAKIEGKEFFKGLEAKIVGSIHLKDIFGEGFELPKLNRTDNKIYYRLITNKLKPVKLGPFAFVNKSRKGDASLLVYLEKPLNNPKSYTACTSLNNFTVGIFENRIIVEFDKLQIFSDQQTKNKVSVNIGDVRFTQELAFLEALSKNIKIPGTGLTLNISPKEINVDFAYTVPGVSGGAFTFDNLKFGVGVYIPIPVGSKNAARPIVAKFGINGPDDKFVVAAGIWGGKGHFVLEATPKYISRIDAGIDFGGYLALNLGIAKGEAFLMAGIRYVYLRDELGETGFELYATLSCGGSVTVFGFITISVVFLLCLKYQKYQGRTTLYGTASVTYSVKIGFFRKSFSLTFSRRLHGSEGGDQNGNIGYDDHYQQQREMYQYAGLTEAEASRGFRFANDTYKGLKDDPPPVRKPLKQVFNACQWRSRINTYKLNSKQRV